MTIATFSPSEAYTRRMIRLLWVILLLSIPLAFLVMAGTPDGLFFFTSAYLGIFVVFLGVILVMIFVLAWVMQRPQLAAWQDSRVILTDTGLERIYRKQREIIPYETIAQVTLWENRQKGVHTIKVVSPQTTAIIAGYGGMNRLSHELISRLTPQQTVRQGKFRFDGTNVWHISGLLLLFIGLWMACGQVFGGETMLFNGVAQAVMGLIFLFVRPQTKSLGKGQRNTDILLGVTLLFLSFLSLIQAFGRDSAAALWSNPCSPLRRLNWTAGCVRVLDESQYAAFTHQSDELVRRFNRGIYQGPVNAWIGLWTPLNLEDGRVEGMNAAANRQRIAIWRRTETRRDDIAVWDVVTQSVVYQYRSYALIVKASQFALSPDGTILAVGDYDDLTLWTIATDQILWSKEDASFEAVAFTPDGKYVVVGQIAEAQTQFVFYDVQSGLPETILTPPEAEFSAGFSLDMHISPDGRWLVAFSEATNRVTVWDLTTGMIAHQFVLGQVTRLNVAMSFSVDSQYLIAGFEDEEANGRTVTRLTFWRLADATLAHEILLGERYDTRIQTLDVSPDGHRLAVGTYDQTFIFDMAELLAGE